MKHLPCLLVALLFCQKTFSQDGQPRTVEITTSEEGGATRFKAKLPQPVPIPGAPEPFMTCHWEFGDGNFSTELNPLYQYAKPGSHDVYLAVTASYDDGTPPKDTKKTGNFTGGGGTGMMAGAGPKFNHVFDEKGQPIALDNNHDARAGEQMVVILSYQNTATTATGGEFHLFYNEKNYKERHFSFEEARAHFDETDMNIGLSFLENHGFRTAGHGLDAAGLMGSFVPGLAQNFPIEYGDELLEKARETYTDEHGWRFEKLKPGEKRNLFVTLVGTAEMLRDTTATITVKGVFLPTNPTVQPQDFVLEIPVVASHDPNLIAVSDKKVNFRFIKKKDLTYKVRFQNNGEGPAKKIELTVEVPKGLNIGKMRPLEWYPNCPICPKNGPKSGCLDTAMTKNGLVFTFQNVYLPGSKQAGLTDRDSTKGFVKYRIEPKKNMAKRAFRSRAHIVFDKNPPVTTNFSKTKFRVGLSPGIKFGYLFDPEQPEDGSYFGGATFSPYKSWRAYPQVEFLVGKQGEKLVSESASTDTIPSTKNNADFRQDTVFSHSKSQFSQSNSFEVPFLLRKNFSRFFGIGLGASARFLFEKSTTKAATGGKVLNYDFLPGPNGVLELTYNKDKDAALEPIETTTVLRPRKTRFTVFADLTIGAVRAGPNIGLRLGGLLDGGFEPFGQVAAEWKF